MTDSCSEAISYWHLDHDAPSEHESGIFSITEDPSPWLRELWTRESGRLGSRLPEAVLDELDGGEPLRQADLDFLASFASVRTHEAAAAIRTLAVVCEGGYLPRSQVGLVVTRALRNPNPVVRGAAAEAAWIGDLDIREELQAAVDGEPDGRVRGLILQVLSSRKS